MNQPTLLKILLAAHAALLLLFAQAAHGQTVHTRRPLGVDEEPPRPRPGRPHVRLRFEPEGQVFALAFSPDGRTLAVCTTNRVVKLWSAETGALLKSLPAAGGPVSKLLWSRDGRALALVRQPFTWSLGSPNEVQLYDVGAASPLRATLKVKGFGKIFKIAWAEDGGTLVTAGEADPKLFDAGRLTAYTWRAADGAPYAAFPLEEARGGFMTNLWETADTVELLAGGRVLLTYNRESVKFWDARTGERLFRREAGHVSVSPDGRLVATALAGATRARVWEAVAP